MMLKLIYFEIISEIYFTIMLSPSKIPLPWGLGQYIIFYVGLSMNRPKVPKVVVS